MPKIIVATNPADEVVVEYLDSWFEKVREKIVGNSEISFIELRKDQANKAELTRVIAKQNPDFVVLNGHGSERSIHGFNQQVLVQCNDNESLLKNRIVHALSCRSGKTLGPKCIEIGTKAYVGYEQDFKLFHFGKRSKLEQLDDNVASLFLEPAFEVVVALVEGNSVEQAFERSQDKYRQKLNVLISGKMDSNIIEIASCLYHDMKYQVRLGDGSALI